MTEIVDVAADTERPSKLEPEDKSALEVLSLKIHNYDLQRNLLMRDLKVAVDTMAALQAELKTTSDRIHAKYGIVLGQDRIDTDGTIHRAK